MPLDHPSPRAVRLLAGAALLASLAACNYSHEDEEYVQSSETEFDWKRGKVLVVENRRGDLEIEELAGQTVRLEARKRIVAPTDEERMDLARQVEVEMVAVGDTVRILVRYPEALITEGRVQVVGRDALPPRARVDLRVALPPGATVRHLTRNGDVRCERYTGTLEYSGISGDAYLDDWRGNVQLTTRSGDASLGRVTGRASMSTVSGDLNADVIDGNLVFDATGGDLSATKVGGDLQATTASGDVAVQLVEGGIAVATTSGDVEIVSALARGNVETSNGDVVVGLRSPDGRMQVRSATGDLEVKLVLPYPGRLEATTASGTMDVQAPITVEQAERNRLTGRLGPGRQTLVLSTASGDITVYGSREGGES